MAKEWHSIGSDVYHNNPACTEGNNIEDKNYREGKGSGTRICTRCKNLNKNKK